MNGINIVAPSPTSASAAGRPSGFRLAFSDHRRLPSTSDSRPQSLGQRLRTFPARTSPKLVMAQPRQEEEEKLAPPPAERRGPPVATRTRSRGGQAPEAAGEVAVEDAALGVDDLRVGSTS